MRISTKLTIALTLAGIFLFGTYGYYRVTSERTRLLRDLERELRLLGRALRLSVENSLRDRQLEDIQETITNLERIDPSVDIYIYNPTLELTAISQPGLSRNEIFDGLALNAINSREPSVELDTSGEINIITFAAPVLSDAGDVLGGLLISKPLTEVESEIDATFWRILLLVVVLVSANTAILSVLGHIYITRPLGGLGATVERIMHGDLDSHVPYEQNDEVGMLAERFNEMITELKRARKRLTENAEEKRNSQLAMQRADKLISIGQLAAGLAHEIGSPLQILSARSRKLISSDTIGEDVKRNLEIIIAQVERISSIVEQLLNLVRQKPLKKVSIDLLPQIKAVVELLEHEIKQKEIALTTECAEDIPLIEADPDQMQQMALNLLNNALAATPTGGRITIFLEKAKFSLTPETEKVDAIKLVVEDNGIGLDGETLPKIFDPFFSLKTEEGGTGLGLYIVRFIVNEHGGRVKADSEPGRGTRFTIVLPVSSGRRTSGQRVIS